MLESYVNMRLFFAMPTMLLVTSVLAQIQPAPPWIFSINQTKNGGVSIVVTQTSVLFPVIVQMSTNLTTSNWVNLQTNRQVSSMVFTNIRAPALGKMDSCCIFWTGILLDSGIGDR